MSHPSFIPPLPKSLTSTSTPQKCSPKSPTFQPPRSTLLTPRPHPCLAPSAPPSQIDTHTIPGHPDWRFVGPPLSHGPFPSILYLALTAEQSLQLDPYNQLVTSLLSQSTPIRIFSATLPLHGEDMATNEAAFSNWAKMYTIGADPVANFVLRASHTVDDLVDKNIIPKDQFVVAGLSRGGLLATLLAARSDYVKACLGLAPVTVLSELDEFDNVGERGREKVKKASLLREDVLEPLVEKPLRFYMGNLDRRVGTRGAFEVVWELAERAASTGVRSPPHEFVMYCSVGKQGHGTPPDVFRAGAEYLLSQVLSKAPEGEDDL